jgi:uncharacterized membrane protein YgcG
MKKPSRTDKLIRFGTLATIAALALPNACTDDPVMEVDTHTDGGPTTGGRGGRGGSGGHVDGGPFKGGRGGIGGIGGRAQPSDTDAGEQDAGR